MSAGLITTLTTLTTLTTNIRRNGKNLIKSEYRITREEYFSDTENLALVRIKSKGKKMKTKQVGKSFFLALFTPELQPLAAREWIRAYTGTAPTLLEVLFDHLGEP